MIQILSQLFLRDLEKLKKKKYDELAKRFEANSKLFADGTAEEVKKAVRVRLGK